MNIRKKEPKLKTKNQVFPKISFTTRPTSLKPLLSILKIHEQVSAEINPRIIIINMLNMIPLYRKFCGITKTVLPTIVLTIVNIVLWHTLLFKAYGIGFID